MRVQEMNESSGVVLASLVVQKKIAQISLL